VFPEIILNEKTTLIIVGVVADTWKFFDLQPGSHIDAPAC